MDYNKLILVEQYFCSNGHDVNKDAKFTTIKIMNPPTAWKIVLDYIMAIIESHEDKLMKCLQTLTPNGFNTRLKSFQVAALK